MATKYGAGLRRLRLMAGLGLEEVESLYPPVSMSRLSRVERGVHGFSLSPNDRAALERVLSDEIRRRAKELNEHIRCDNRAVAV